MAHIQHFMIESYRGIGGEELSDFGDVNLIVGDNGTGKTSILEAIWLFGGRGNAGLLWQNNVQRTDVQEVDPIRALENDCVKLMGTERTFDGKSICTTYELEFVRATDQWKSDVRLKEIVQALANVPPVPGLPPGPKQLAGEIRGKINGQVVTFGTQGFNLQMIGNQCVLAANQYKGLIGNGVLTGVTDLARVNQLAGQWYAAIARKGPSAKKEFLKTLRVVRPEITDIEMIPRNIAGQEASYFQVEVDNDKVLKVESVGNGLRKILDLALSISAAENGIVLIDEIENGINPKRMDLFVKALVRSAEQYNAQIIATTHSVDLVDRFIKYLDSPDQSGAVPESQRSLRLFDLDNGHKGHRRGETGCQYSQRNRWY